LALSDTLVANSQLVAQWLNAPERTVIVPNTLDFSRFDLSLRSEGTSLNVALISSNIPKKGLQDFVTLARQLSIATDFRLACLLIGPENGHVAALRQGQASGEIAENLHFFGMASDPLVALAEADIVLNLSSFQESFGRVVLEAMAARRPVVCYDWGALSELVVDGETGFLTPYGKVDAVADAVLTLAANPALRSRMGEAGRTRAMALCGWPVFLEQLQCSINPFQE
jgi:glycosyltransferase involved in cell wall biosynthesis